MAWVAPWFEPSCIAFRFELVFLLIMFLFFFFFHSPPRRSLLRSFRTNYFCFVNSSSSACSLSPPPHTAKGRTNIELREQFILADGVSQTMTAFKPKTSASSPASGSSASSLRTPQGPITKVLHSTLLSVCSEKKASNPLAPTRSRLVVEY